MSHTPASERLADALRASGRTVRPQADGRYVGECPTHGGRELKLSIRQHGDRAKVHCYKGCDDRDILGAIGLDVGDLYDEPRARNGHRVNGATVGQGELDLQTPTAAPSPWDGLPIVDHHRQVLESSAIAAEVARAAGVYSITAVTQLPEQFAKYGRKAVPALAFPWRSPGGTEATQLRPDTPVVDDDGGEHKYLWPSGVSSILNAVRPIDDPTVILAVEGTKQALAAASYAAPNVAVYGLAGCRSWSTDGIPVADLEIVDGRAAVVAFDADIASNVDVWTAASRFADALLAEGATEVRYLTLPASAKSGLDDVLASRKPDRRAAYLSRLIHQAKVKLPPKPAKKVKRDEGGYFGDDGLLVERLYNGITARHPAALTRERRVALYRGGVYHIDSTAFSGVIAEMLGDRFRPFHRAAAEEFAAGMLYNGGIFLPDRCASALLNVSNGMLDLATATLKPHDPSYLSSTQLPIVWDPEATCPTYERWLAEAIGGQVDDLEEVTSTMLDPSRTPTKAVFLFGPTRSGKSTFLRLLQAVAGPENMSAVTLHQLAGNRFAAANVYGKILNCAADLSSAHVEDMSIFKMMTGEDPIQADRKHGGQFAFVNRALFAFSANELPTVSESSRAYVERIKPFEFPKSFAGNEDPTIEERMLSHELPGILARWVRAWQRVAERGHFLKTDERVRKEFETRSDRVRQWVAECCKVVRTTAGGAAVAPNTLLPPFELTTRRELAQAFNLWAEDNNGSRMGERKIIDRLTNMAGVYEVRRSTDRTRGLNIIFRGPNDDDDEEPTPPSADGLVAETTTAVAVSGASVAVSGTDSATDNAQASTDDDLQVAEMAVSGHTLIREAPFSHPTCERGSSRDQLGAETAALARKAQCSETATSATSATTTAQGVDTWPAAATRCAHCGWPMGSNGHAENCGTGRAA